MENKLLLDPTFVKVPPNRQRTVFNQAELDELAMSIKTNGQIQPIVLTQDFTIVVGERRVRACKQLGIPVWYTVTNITKETVLKELELEENLRRTDLTWFDRAKAIREIHNLHVNEYGAIKKGRSSNGWSIEDTGSCLNMGASTVGMYLGLAEAIESGKYPDLVEKKALTEAWTYLRKTQEQQTIEKLKEFYPEKTVSPIRTGVDSWDVPEQTEDENVNCGDYLSTDYKLHLLNEDCLTVMSLMPPESVDLIYTDPMWGIDFDTLEQDVPVGDEPEKCKNIMEQFISLAASVLKQDSWMVMWFGVEHYSWLVALCKKNGLGVNVSPILWTKNNGKANMMEYCFGHAYEMALMIKKGQPVLAKRRVLDYFNVPQVPRPRRKMEKPVQLAKEIIECLSNPGDLVFDGFMGTGTSMAAAWQLGRVPLGCEIDPEGFNYAVETWEREVNG